jgi:hypothetical protein
MFLSLLLVQQKNYELKDCHFVVQHDFQFSADILPQIENLSLIIGNIEVNQENKIKRYFEKIKLCKNIEVLSEQEYSTLYVFNDAKEISQYLIYRLKKKFNSVCCYVEDGSAIYTNQSDLAVKPLDPVKKNAKHYIKNFILGKYFVESQRALIIHGTYPLLDEMYGLYPEFITRDKKVFEINYQNNNMIQKFYPNVFESLYCLLEKYKFELISLYFIPLIEEVNLGGLLKQVEKLVQLQKLSKRVLIKNHPRQDSKYLSVTYLEQLFIDLGFKPLVVNQTIPSELIYEFLKLRSFQVKNIISGPSTSLITARKMLTNNQEIIAMLVESKPFSKIYKRLDIECIFYEV